MLRRAITGEMRFSQVVNPGGLGSGRDLYKAIWILYFRAQKEQELVPH